MLAEEQAVVRRADQVLARYPRSARALRLAGRVLREQGTEQIGLAASGAAFWLVISAFPIAIAAVNLFGLVVAPEQVAKDLGGLATAGPASLGSFVTDQLHRVAAGDHAGLSVGLAVSLVLAIWSASAGVYNLNRAIRHAYGLAPTSYVEARGRAFAGAFVVVVAIGGAGWVSAADGPLRRHVPGWVVTGAGVPILVAVMAAVIAGLYRFAVGGPLSRRALLPGAVSAAAGLFVLGGGFTVYVHLSSHYTVVYGALAGAVIGMVGIYLGVYVILLGALLNIDIGRPT